MKDILISWCHTPIISALRRLKQEDHCKFKACLGYILNYLLRPCFKKSKIEPGMVAHPCDPSNPGG